MTRVVSQSFAGLADRPASVEMEVRASWTPLGPRSATTSSPGPTCCAPSPGSPRCPRAWSPFPDPGAEWAPRQRPPPPRAPPPPRWCRSTSLPTASPTSSRPSASWPAPPPRVAAGEGPVAIDAERASGYRYGQRAYLVQVRREGAGTWLIDPVGCPDLAPLDEAIGAAEWILHAATQDLACLAEVGPAAAPAVRHRARRPHPGAAPGGPRRGGRALPRAQPGQGALRGRLVDPAAARAVAALRRARRRGARELRNLMGVDLAAPGQVGVGPPGVHLAARPGPPPSASTRGGARRA